MTVELFRSDPYRSDFAACVTRCDGDWVTLDQTCFWPGDGQMSEHDLGWLGQHEVLDVRRGERSQLSHLLSTVGGRPPAPGDHLVGTIDWGRRYRMMRAHTAQHLVDLALRVTHDVAGLTMSTSLDGRPELSLILASGQLDSRAIVEWVANVVSDDLPMQVGEELDSPTRRVWHLDGHGHRPCNGLHVSSTGEVGTVNLHRAGENGVRVQLQLEVGEVVDIADGSA